MERMKEKCNWKGIGTLMVITVCLVSVMSPALTQSSLSLFGNVSNGTNGETGDESIPTSTPTPTLTPSPTPTPSLTPTPDPTSSPSPAPAPTPSHSPTPTSGPTPTLTPTPSPTPTLTPAPTPAPPPTTPAITSFAPASSPVYDTEGAPRTFNITINPAVNVSWLFNGTEVQINESVTEASCTNTSSAVGIWNITAVATNENGTAKQTWIWNVSQQVTLTPALETPPQTDLAVTDLRVDPENPILGELVNITASIINNGPSSANSSAIFYDEKNLSIFKLYWNISTSDGTDTITQPGALKIRVHFIDMGIQREGSYVKIYNESNVLFDSFTAEYKKNFWSNWSTGEKISIESHTSDHLYFMIDKYEAVFAKNESMLLDAGESVDINTKWNALAWLNDKSIALGNHSIRVEVVPENLINDTDKSNNNMSILVEVKPLTDLELTKVSIDKTPLLDGDLVNVTANVRNNGFGDAPEFKVRFLDGLDEGNTGGEVFNESVVSALGAGSTTTVSTTWNVSFGNHTITVIADPDDSIPEFDETNNQNSTYIYANKSRDFAVTNISLSYTGSNESRDPNNLFLYEQVTINATLEIINLANRGGKFDVGLYLDNIDTKQLINKSRVVFDRNGTYYALFEWRVNAAGNHSIKVCADHNNTITEFNETNNTKSVAITVLKGNDFEVTNLMFNPPEPVIGDEVEINATIANFGVENGTTFVEFYDSKSIEIKRTTGESSINDTLTLPGALGMRVHFSFIEYGIFTIYDKNNTKVEEFQHHGIIIDKWTRWALGDTIRIESQVANFTIDKYEALLANVSIPLDAGNYTNISAEWNLSDQYMGRAINGTHNITVKVDPYNQIVESNETNNEKTQKILIRPSLDFAVTNIFFNPPEPLLYNTVEINATIKNFGVRNGTTIVEVYYDNISIANKTISLNATGNESKIVNASWNATAAGYHNISVKIDPLNLFAETNETNNTLTTQIFVNGTDLAVLNIGIPCGLPLLKDCYRGQDVDITATISNFGALDAPKFTVFFKEGIGEGNTSGSDFFNKTILRLKSSEKVNIPVMWTPTEFGYHTITVNISFDKTDNNKTNNERFENVSVNSEYDFSVENVSVTPREVREGANVTINATIGNLGLKSENVTLGFYVNSTDFVGSEDERFTRIGTVHNVSVGVNETNITAITWNANITGGNHTIFAVVNPDNNPEEYPYKIEKIGDSIVFKGNRTNNVRNCTLHVISPKVNITNLSLYPAQPLVGDKVNVTALVEHKGSESEPANTTVWFSMEKNLSIKDDIWFEDDEKGNQRCNWSVSQPEPHPIRVHFADITINNYWGEDVGFGSVDDYVSAYVDGHPVYFYVKSKDMANGQPIKVSKIDFNSPCANCTKKTLECREKLWKDVWTEWSEGKTLVVEVIAPGRVNLDLKIDKYQVRLGSRTVTLNAGESTPYNITWTALPLELREFKDWKLVDEKTLIGENYNYTFAANVEDKVERTETYLGGTDLAVDFSLNETYFDGNEVNFTATIKNLGSKNAANFTVNFTEVYVPTGGPSEVGVTVIERYNNYTLINTTHVVGLEAGNTTIIPVSWNTSIRNIVCEGLCKGGATGIPCPSWNETAENYTIKVEIIPLDYLDYNETNNVLEREVNLKRSRDFEVTNLSFVVNDETCSRDSGKVYLKLHENATLNATLNITNLANRGGCVNVSFYLDDREHEIGNDSITFDAGNGTRYAVLKEWRVENFDDVRIPGKHNIIVIPDPENETIELNESNNDYVQEIFVIASDLMVTNLTFDSENLEEGNRLDINDSVNITVEIVNYGNENVSNVTLGIYDWADRQIEDVKGYSGLEQMEIERENATAMRLYLDLAIKGGEVCIKNSYGKPKKCYYDNFHGWTPWVLDNNITVVMKSNETSNASAYAKISKVYYLKSCDPINRTTLHNLSINETRSITVEHTVSTVGERLIAAIIDPENKIPEYDESDNTKAEYLTVHTADLKVSNLTLKWQDNGTKIGENETIKHGDNLTITANVSNIGIEEAKNFTVHFFVDNFLTPDGEIPNLILAPNDSKPLSANWTAIVGGHVIKIEVDYGDNVDETNETNNIEALERYVCGAELSGNTTWETLGLAGQILFDKTTQPCDEDEVNITVNITNYGCLDAKDFNVLMFFNYTPEVFIYGTWETEKGMWENRTYATAQWIYLDIDVCEGERIEPLDKGDIIIRNGSEVINDSVNESCWIQVPGDTVNIHVLAEYKEKFVIYFYPVYQDNSSWLYDRISVSVNDSKNLTPAMNRIVSTGNYTVTAFIDPENRVPEDSKTDNVVTEEMEVLPTRDFTVTEVIVNPEKTNISDVDKITITANVSNVGYRNGTTKVEFVDYENETRIHKYYLYKTGKNLTYLPVSPDETLSSNRSYNRNLTIIHRPGVDAIKLNFSWKLNQPGWSEEYKEVIPHGEIMICNETGKVWSAVFNKEPEPKDWNHWAPGDMVYIYITNAYFNLSGYTTVKEFYREENVTLNASVTWDKWGNITAMGSEPRNITAPQWNASAGVHNITVTIDPENKIGEMKESNNAFNLPLKVSATRDPAIVDVNYSVQNPAPGQDPWHPNDGDNVTIKAVVRNNGTEKANFRVDLWADTTRRLFTTDSVPEDVNWSISVEDKIRYVKLLKHKNVSLAPGENETVTAIWENMSIYGDPTYVVRAIVDPLDVIDEMNESNNEMSPAIIMNASDFAVARFISPTEQNNASVIIENQGAIGASNVTVRFELCRSEPYTLTGGGSQNITKEGAANLRIHFLELDTTGESAFFEIWGIGEDGTAYRVKKYSGVELWNKWTPWVQGDTIWIEYCNASFWIDEYMWGDVEDRVIEYLNGSESLDVSLPWQDYERPERLNVTVDPYNNITEQREDNNNGTALIYIDLVLKGVEIDVDGNWIKATVWSDDTLEGGIVFPPDCDFEVSCSPGGFVPETINKSFYGGDTVEVLFDINEGNFQPNRKYNLLVKADSEDVIEELDETNNNGSLWIGPDIEVEQIDVWPGYPVIGHHTCNINVTLKNKGYLRAEDFEVTAYLDITYLNATDGIESANETLPQKSFSLNPNENETLTFDWAPQKYGKSYYDVSKIKIMADPEPDKVDELDETNNEMIRSDTWRIYNETGYDANHPLITKYHDEMVKCNVDYTIGDSYYLKGCDSRDEEAMSEEYGPVHFNDIVPDGVTVKHARLYLYWTWGYVKVDDPLRPGETKPSPVPLDVEVTFNTHTFHSVPADGNYVDLPTATGWDVAWGTYAYDVTNDIIRNNTVNAIRKVPTIGNATGISVPAIAGMGLLVIYERDDLPRTTYWINEGADVLYMLGPTTGLTPEDCTTDAVFKGEADLDRVNATLWTIVPFGDTGNNRLFFNSGEWDGVWDGYPEVERRDPEIAIDKQRYVTNYLKPADNEAGLQDRGDGGGMMPSNAFLILTYPPDLVEPYIPKSVVVGKRIPVVIENRGRSDALDFNVSFEVDGVFKGKTEHVDVETGRSTPLTFPWIPRLPGQFVTLNVSVDCDTDVSELREDNNNFSQEVAVVDVFQPVRGGGSISPWKEGLGPGEGPGEGAGAGTTAGTGGKGAMGEKGGKAITGYLMKGTVASSEEGGGGKVEFSILGLLMRLAVLAVAVVLVGVGYLLERKRHNYKQ